jgi:hypothetical protein
LRFRTDSAILGTGAKTEVDRGKEIIMPNKRLGYLRELVQAEELAAEDELQAKGLLNSDIDTMSEKQRAALDESEVLVLAWRQHVRLYPEWEPFREGGELDGMNPRAHIAVHGLVEAMLRGSDPTAKRELKRLMREGECRHDAIHEIGEVLMRALHDIAREKDEVDA